MNYANYKGYSDTRPYEVIRWVSDKTAEIRQMDAELDPSWEPEWVSGGFAGSCTNQHTQTWIYSSNPEYKVIRMRLRKDGRWYSAYGRHALSDEPRMFYDYNF